MARASLPAATPSICPHRGVALEAELIDRDRRVFLRRECPEHGLVGCNLDCPVCFAESGTGHRADGYSLSLAQVESMLDAFVAAEGQPEAVQLSGGEPSIHPEILDMLAAAKARGIPLVMLNTNGIRLARDARHRSEGMLRPALRERRGAMAARR